MILFVTEQIGVPQGATSVYCHGNPFWPLLQDYHCGVTMKVMGKPELSSSTDKPPTSTFTKALTSILSASPKQVRESHDEAKKGKFSSHTRYKYVPAKRP